jgi:GNAT superfamily N-acetyltransferase
MHRVRLSVLENRLRSLVLRDEDYRERLEAPCRSWVIEDGGQIVAFASADARNGNVWALFVHPAHEGRGHGRRLHDCLVDWLVSEGLSVLWLTTAPGTRAQRFYEMAGWKQVAEVGDELRFELRPPRDRR